MDALYQKTLDRISLTAMRRIAVVLLMSITIGAALAFDFSHRFYPGGEVPRFGGHEIAEWHVTADGRVRVHSRITFSKSLANAVYLPLELPYEAGEVESITLGGEPIHWFETAEGEVWQASGLNAVLNVPDSALEDRLLEVTWSFPFDELPWEDPFYRIRLRSLIPVKSYALVAFLDEDCGYRMANDTDVRVTRPFWNRSRRYVTDRGTCGLTIRPDGAA